MNTISPKGTLTPTELKKSIRDSILGGSAIMIPEILNAVGATDFGEYTMVVQLALLIFTFLNRKYNWFRI